MFLSSEHKGRKYGIFFTLLVFSFFIFLAYSFPVHAKTNKKNQGNLAATTPTNAILSSTPTPTLTPTPSLTPVSTPTSMVTPALIFAPPTTPTPIPADPTSTPISSPTDIPTPSPTVSDTPTPTPSGTPSPTLSPNPIPVISLKKPPSSGLGVIQNIFTVPENQIFPVSASYPYNYNPNFLSSKTTKALLASAGGLAFAGLFLSEISFVDVLSEKRKLVKNLNSRKSNRAI